MGPDVRLVAPQRPECRKLYCEELAFSEAVLVLQIIHVVLKRAL